MLVDNSNIYLGLAQFQESYDWKSIPENVRNAYEKEMLLRLSWNTNHLEGNTLSLDETIDVIEYDTVKSGHTYAEYTEAKSAYKANSNLLDFRNPVVINEKYIQKANGIIMGTAGEYRKSKVYIGTLIEAAYFPPGPEDVPMLMQDFVERLSQETFLAGTPLREPSPTVASLNGSSLREPSPTEASLSGSSPTADSEEIPLKKIKTIISNAALLHMDFERIHPFQDGNGRTGRLFINQYLLNHGLLPIIIEDTSKYRQAFRIYERNGDRSLMEHCLASGIRRSCEILATDFEKLTGRKLTSTETPDSE